MLSRWFEPQWILDFLFNNWVDIRLANVDNAVLKCMRSNCPHEKPVAQIASTRSPTTQFFQCVALI